MILLYAIQWNRISVAFFVFTPLSNIENTILLRSCTIKLCFHYYFSPHLCNGNMFLLCLFKGKFGNMAKRHHVGTANSKNSSFNSNTHGFIVDRPMHNPAQSRTKSYFF